MKYYKWIVVCLLFLLPSCTMLAGGKTRRQSDRAYWCSLAYKIAQPVLENMSKGELQKNMQTEFSPTFDHRNKKVLYMECFGRLMAGIAPWLSLPDDSSAEGKQRKQLREWALSSYRNAVDPQSPDYLCWGIYRRELPAGLRPIVGASRYAYQAKVYQGVYWIEEDRSSLHQLAPVFFHDRELHG